MSDIDWSDSQQQHTAQNKNQMEQVLLEHAVTVFKGYETISRLSISASINSFKAFERNHRKYLNHVGDKFSHILTRISINQAFLDLIAQPHQLFENQAYLPSALPAAMSGRPGPADAEFKSSHAYHKVSSDIEKVNATIKQFVRDWSQEGEYERSLCYEPIISALLREFPAQTIPKTKVLVPGAGLGRLCMEIVCRGFITQGNEYSYYMLLAAHYILNRHVGRESINIYPWIMQFSNNLSSHDQLRAVSIPDIVPIEVIPTNANFSMTAGNFIQCYTTTVPINPANPANPANTESADRLNHKTPFDSDPNPPPLYKLIPNPDSGLWDAICTCFFLDTSPNPLNYIEVIHSILKPGGIWINFGPLLYHYADDHSTPSLELSYNELKEIIIQFGFVYETERLNVDCPYIYNYKSLYPNSYKNIFFVARKLHT